MCMDTLVHLKECPPPHVHKLWACTFHYASFPWSFDSSSPYNLYIGHEIHMVIELQQTCPSVTRFHMYFNLQFTWNKPDPLLKQNYIANTCSINQKAQLKLASTVCGEVSTAMSGKIKEHNYSYIMTSVKAGWDHTWWVLSPVWPICLQCQPDFWCPNTAVSHGLCVLWWPVKMLNLLLMRSNNYSNPTTTIFTFYSPLFKGE